MSPFFFYIRNVSGSCGWKIKMEAQDVDIKDIETAWNAEIQSGKALL